jgi:RNA methyltransferase, TrmH family
MICMLPITSLQNPTIKVIRSLSEKKGRRDHNLWIAEGFKMLERALVCGWRPDHLVATKPVHVWDDVKPLIVSEKIMSELSAQNNPHDVLATFAPRWFTQPEKTGPVLALEEIRDPGNLGTILRTADAAGFGGVVLAGDCCDPFSPECVRASTGSIFATSLTRLPSSKLVDLIKGWPGESVGTAMGAAKTYTRGYAGPALIVLGSEAKGLSQAVSSACKTLVKIPMKDGVESLNVGTAAALLMYEIGRNE